MIPLRLQLKNFLSYGPELQTIDFEPYSLICLSGKNGHGKSALLDAITWALWGQARKVSGTPKSDDALLRIGQTQMIVILDFLCNTQTYRIRREYMKTYGKPLVSVDFGLLDREKDTFIPLSDKTIRTTQAKIEQTLRLDYDSFINSAFLRQGQANEFSKKSPKERKEVLCTILGLSAYELIRKLATEKARNAQIEKTNLSSFYDKIDQELQLTHDAPAQLATVTSQLSDLAQQEQQINTQQHALDDQNNKLTQDKNSLQLLTFQLEQIKKNDAKELKTLHDIRAEWKMVHAKQLHLSDRRILEQKKAELITRINEYQAKRQQSLELKEKQLACKGALQNLTHELQRENQLSLQQQSMHIERLTVEKQHYEQLCAQLLSTAQEHEITLKKIEEELKKNQTEQHKTKFQQHDVEALIKQFEKRKEHYQRFIMQGSLMKQELHNLEQKQHLSQDDSNPSCPLCEQNLSASRRKFLKQKFVKEERFLTYRIGRLAKIVKKLKDLLINQHNTIEQLKKGSEEHKILQLKEEELINKKNELCRILQSLHDQRASEEKIAKEKNEELLTAHKNLDKDKQKTLSHLETNSLLKKQKDEVEQYEKQLQGITYDPELHTRTQKELQALEEQIKLYQQDVEQIALQDKRKQQIHSLCQSLKEHKKHRLELEQKINPFLDIEARENELTIKGQGLSTQKSEINKQKEHLFQEKGRLEQQYNKRLQLEKDKAQYSKQIGTLDETIGDYQAVAMATGKDGIQALLIQDIIPEIEQEANMLLSKLTDNQAQIFIESLRDLKKGGTKETLDIKISDSIGIRPYELFSGGEAFRIDFALRIAISKLLARRSGTTLQTLIIDEGFGSQDEEGLSHIMDAIYKIQDDFSKVIIVSHLSSMKELFPVHFFVEKGPQGSRITTLEQG